MKTKQQKAKHDIFKLRDALHEISLAEDHLRKAGHLLLIMESDEPLSDLRILSHLDKTLKRLDNFRRASELRRVVLALASENIPLERATSVRALDQVRQLMNDGITRLKNELDTKGKEYRNDAHA